MPVKRRTEKRRKANQRSVQAALEAAGPGAYEADESGAGIILDEALANALGLPVLIRYPDIRNYLPLTEKENIDASTHK